MVTTPPPYEIRYATPADGTAELDEVIARDAHVHLEKMNDAQWWLGIDLPDGTHIAVNLGVDEDGEYANVDVEEPVSVEVQPQIDGLLATGRANVEEPEPTRGGLVVGPNGRGDDIPVVLSPAEDPLVRPGVVQRYGLRALRAINAMSLDLPRADAPARPVDCCGKCPPIFGGGYDCTCDGNPRCPNHTTATPTHAPNRDAMGVRSAEQATNGHREGRDDSRPAERRWRIRRYGAMWRATDPNCRGQGEDGCRITATWTDAIDHVNTQLRNRALNAIENQEGTC